jgi:hypothetical protein
MIRKMFLVFMQKVLLKSQIDPPYVWLVHTGELIFS